MSADLAALMARIVALEAWRASMEAGGGMAKADGVADDRDLDGQYGNEVIKSDPKRWIENGGESYAGCKMSECPSEYLRDLANRFDWMADQDEKKGKIYVNKKTGKTEPVAPFSRKSAARARGWALRNQGKAAASAPQQNDFSDEAAPF